MFAEFALKLVPVLDAYFTIDEFRELAAIFAVQLDALDAYEPKWLSIGRELTSKLDHGNTRRLVDSALELAERRNSDGVAHTKWERQSFHVGMQSVIDSAKELLEGTAAPSEIAVAAGHSFSAKSKVRELMETATTEILIVDPYIGVGTLDCIRNIAQPIRILTGLQQVSVEAGFEGALAAFVAEGHQVTIRRAQQLHDRHIIFNDRCWLVGGSLKDAGKKPFNCIEVSDQKALVVVDLENRWSAATPYP